MKKSNIMKRRVQAYLDYRRSLGFSLRIEGQQLLRFADYVDNKNYQGPLTEELAIEWAKSSKKASRITWARRLETIRCFAKYCLITESETQVPEKGIFGKSHRRQPPYIFSEDEIHQIIDTTKYLIPQNGLRPLSFRYLFSLLYVTGLRVSEALRLLPEDVDLNQGILTIRKTKFNKSRLVPLDNSTVKALSDYRDQRNIYWSREKPLAFFIIDNGEPITLRAADYAFLRIRNLLGWNITLREKMPRIYDLRHTFICYRVLEWYKQGADVYTLIPYLSTYVGHVKVSDTYWYLTGIPQLMKVVSEKFNHYVTSPYEGAI
jgi:integrase